MKTIYINPLHPLFTEQLQEAFTHNQTVVCSHRPLNGDFTFQYDNIGYGRYYAVGNMDQYNSNWLYLDADIIQLRTNEDVIQLVTKEIEEEGIQLDELLTDCTISEIADSLGYMYID